MTPTAAGPGGGPDGVPDPIRVARLITDFAADQDLPCEPGTRDGELVVTLPGEHKLKTVVSLLVRAHEVRASAFVIRNADENHEQFYRYLLRRNLRLPGAAYAIDAAGDVFVTASIPTAAVDPEAIDALFGVMLDAADGAFDELLVLGFLTSMRREWAWRVDRGESLRNLEAFRDVLDPQRTGNPDITPDDPAMDDPSADDRGDGRAATVPT